jgi:tetratricopeptide (TPR) repeat protein
VLGISEALYELSRLAGKPRPGRSGRELLESAIQGALQDDREARKLQRTLRTRGDAPLLIRVLRSRLSHGPEASSRPRSSASWPTPSTRPASADEALGCACRPCRTPPARAALHRAAAEQAARLGQSQRYVDALTGLIDARVASSTAPLAADLLMRVAEITEREFGDLDQAAELYGRVEALEHRVVEAWMGLARIAAARGDSARQVELFERISSAPADAMSPETRARAAFGLAEIHLAAPRAATPASPRCAAPSTHDPRYEVAEPILRRTLAPPRTTPSCSPSTSRSSATSATAPPARLPRAPRRQPTPSPAVAREATELARESGDREREVERSSSAPSSSRAQRPRRRAHHLGPPRARRAATATPATSQAPSLPARRHRPRRAARTFALGLELAGLAAKKPDTLSLAAELYEDLLAQDPGNRTVWAPLMEVYKQLDDQSRLQQLVESTLQTLSEPRERNALRLELVRNLLANIGRETDAVRLLKDILMDEPSHKEAEAHARRGLRAHRLRRRARRAAADPAVLTAQEAGDVDGVVASALRLGELQRRTQPDEAKSVYRMALDFAPHNRALIEALLTPVRRRPRPARARRDHRATARRRERRRGRRA